MWQLRIMFVILSAALNAIAVICSLQGLLVTFYAVMIVCDNHLVPTVEVFIQQFEVPETVLSTACVCPYVLA